MQLFVRASRTHVLHVAQDGTVLHVKQAVEQREGALDSLLGGPVAAQRFGAINTARLIRSSNARARISSGHLLRARRTRTFALTHAGALTALACRCRSSMRGAAPCVRREAAEGLYPPFGVWHRT